MITVRSSEVQSVVTIEANLRGPRVVIFGGVHGDESSGILAIERLAFDLIGGRLKLSRGTVILARANEEAITKGKRYVTRNLNRLFKDFYAEELGRTYEFRRANQLKKVLVGCDYFLDLHSAPIAQEPFLLTEVDCVSTFSELGIRRMITGWSKFAKSTIGGDAETYAQTKGAKAATIESGCHFDKSGTDVAYRAAISLLASLQMISAARKPRRMEPQVYEIYKVLTKKYPDFQYAGKVENFKLLRTGQTFAFENSKPLRVREESYLLIPMPPENTSVGEEICYLGRALPAYQGKLTPSVPKEM